MAKRKIKTFVTATKEGIAPVKMELTDAIKFNFVNQYGDSWLAELLETGEMVGNDNAGNEIAFTTETTGPAAEVIVNENGYLESKDGLSVRGVKRFVNSKTSKDDKARFGIIVDTLSDPINVTRNEFFHQLGTLGNKTGDLHGIKIYLRDNGFYLVTN